MKIRLASWNVSCGIVVDDCLASLDVVKYIGDTVTSNSIDILLLQEVIVEPKESGCTSLCISKNCSLQYYCDHALSQSHLVDNVRMGVSILSKTNLIRTSIYQIPYVPLEIKRDNKQYIAHEKAFLGCFSPSLGIQFIVGHCPSFAFFNTKPEYYGEEIFKPLENELINRSMLCPTIIGGDFNTQNVNELMPRLYENFSSAIRTSTRPNGTQTDYIFARGVQLLDSYVIPTLFDHSCCIAEVELLG